MAGDFMKNSQKRTCCDISLITQIEEQQNIMAEMLQILPDTEELLALLEKQADRIRKLTT